MEKKNDRFDGFSTKVRELVIAFEEMLSRGHRNYMDEDQVEIIIDYYLECNDLEMLSKAVGFAEGLFPYNNEIRLRRCHLLCALGHYKRALPLLLNLEQQEPNNTDIAYALGALYSAIDDHNKSLQYFLKAASDGYELGMVYGNIADEYSHLGRNEEAVTYYKKSLKASSTEVRSIYNLVQTFERLGAYKELIDYFETFILQHPYSKEAWLSLAYGYHNINNYEKGIDACEYALAIDDQFFEAYQELSDLHRDKGNIEDAVTALRRCIKFAPSPQDIYIQIGILYMDFRSNYATALLYFKKALDIDPSNSDGWYDMALCYLRQANPWVGPSIIGWCIENNDTYQKADYSDARNAIGKALKLSPASPDYLLLAATIASLSGDNEQAEILCRYAVELEDYDSKYWAALATFMMFVQNKWDEAIEILHDGMVKCDDPATLQLLLAICYYKTGHRNFLFNALSAAVRNCPELIPMMLDICPEMKEDIDVMNIVNASD